MADIGQNEAPPGWDETLPGGFVFDVVFEGNRGFDKRERRDSKLLSRKLERRYHIPVTPARSG